MASALRGWNFNTEVKKHKIFSVHTTPEEFNNDRITGCFGFEENSVREIISKRSVLKMSSVHTKKKSRRFQFKERFHKAPVRFRSGLVWTADSTVEIKLLQIPPVSSALSKSFVFVTD